MHLPFHGPGSPITTVSHRWSRRVPPNADQVSGGNVIRLHAASFVQVLLRSTFAHAALGILYSDLVFWLQIESTPILLTSGTRHAARRGERKTGWRNYNALSPANSSATHTSMVYGLIVRDVLLHQLHDPERSKAKLQKLVPSFLEKHYLAHLPYPRLAVKRTGAQ
ncbi:hypothetical protein BDV06DRAFT_25094 [Aspergillus oleicola]